MPAAIEHLNRRNVVSNLKQRITHHFRPGKESQASPTKLVQLLPDRVRYAMAHGEAQLNSGEISTLFAGGLSNLGFYMTMKSTSDDRLQRILLNNVAHRDFNPAQMTVEDAGEALDVLRARESEAARSTSSAMDVRRSTGVLGAKLGEVSRVGFRHWVDLFETVLDKELQEQPDSELFMVANAPYIGLDVLARHTLQRGRPLYILRPDRFYDPVQPVGWQLSQSTEGVDIQAIPNGFERPYSAIIFDDTVKNGAKRSAVMQFWAGREQENPPRFVTAHSVNPEIAGF